MDSSSDDKEKTPPEDDHQDLQLKEEDESEAEEEEMEEDQSSRASTMIASIGVVTSRDKFNQRGCATPHLSSTDISVRQQHFPYSNS
jgi:hypothetical protein